MQEARANAVEKMAKCSTQNPSPKPNPDNSFATINNESEIQGVEEHVKIQKDIVVAHWDPGLYESKLWPLTCLFGVSFGALHLVPSNTVFPTIIELWLWRVSVFLSIVSMPVFMHVEKVVVALFVTIWRLLSAVFINLRSAISIITYVGGILFMFCPELLDKCFC